MRPGACRIEWATPSGHLLALEPTLDEVAAHAPALAASYNHPHNAALLGHGDEFDEEDVVAHYRAMEGDRARTFLLFRDGQFVGDADLRGVAHGAAEFAFMVAATESQGKGLGTRFATMLHAFGFAQLGLHHLYASIAPSNTASRRVFEKLGCVIDTSAGARGFAETPEDVVMSIDRAAFERQHAAALAEIRITPRQAVSL